MSIIIKSNRILILANNADGLCHFRGMLINELIKKGYTVTAAIPNESSAETLQKMGVEIINVPVDRRGINPKTDFSLFRKYYKLIKALKPSLVITYTIKPNIYGGFAARLLKTPYAVNITGLGTAFQKAGLLKKLVITMYKSALKKAKAVFFENSANMQVFENYKIAKKEKYILLNGAGVDLDLFRPLEYPEQSNTTRFLFVGRVMKEKGIEELFKAMKQLIDDGKNCSLDIVGEFEEDYKETIDTYVREGWLNYHGYQKDVRPFIEKAHCFVLPSWHEGMANTNLECAASARPIITSNISGCKEAVIVGKSGFLCESKNAESLYNAMKGFISLAYDKRVAMGISGRAHIEAVFDKRLVVEETLKGLGL